MIIWTNKKRNKWQFENTNNCTDRLEPSMNNRNHLKQFNFPNASKYLKSIVFIFLLSKALMSIPGIKLRHTHHV